MTILINQDFKALIPPLSAEEFAGLEENIKRDGCREPLVVWNNTLVDGHNRFDICTRNNIQYKTIGMYFPDADAVVEWIIKNQFGRRNLSLHDRSKLALRLEDVYRERAKANQATSTGGANPQLCQKSDKAEQVNTLKEVAKIAGVSHDTIHKVKTIESKGTPEQKADLSAGKTTINKVYKEIKGKDVNPSVVAKPQPYTNAFQFSTIAISQLTRIRKEDPQRVAALLEVKEYVDQQLNS